MHRRTGPLSRAGRKRSSPLRMACLIWVLDSLRWSFCAAAISLRVRGTLARAFLAASASLRDGVGRPFLWASASLIGSAVTGVVSVFVRRNNAMLPGEGDGAWNGPLAQRTVGAATLTPTHSLNP